MRGRKQGNINVDDDFGEIENDLRDLGRDHGYGGEIRDDETRIMSYKVKMKERDEKDFSHLETSENYRDDQSMTSGDKQV